MKVIILHDLRSAYNVGAIFRTADAAGVSMIYLIGHTPQPIDRFGRRQPEIEKTSLGAARSVPWQTQGSIETVFTLLRSSDYSIVAAECTTKAVMLHDFVVPDRVAYVFGNEVTGLPETLLAVVDLVVAIPMHGSKESLNVSVAAGIMMYHGLV